MAKGDGKTLESLYIELGLDISKLQADILAADKTVTENLGRLNREKNTIKLRVEADIAALDRVKNATQILEIQERGLNQQLTLSRDKLAILEAAYKQVASNKNSTALAVQRAEQAFLKEKIAVEQLEQKLKSLSTQKFSIDATHLQDNITRLNAQIQHVRIQADIDVSKLQGANSAFDAQKVHIAAVTNELELQRQKLIQLREAMYQSAKNFGGDSNQTLNIKSNVLEQIRQINQIEAKLKELKNTDVNLRIRADSIKQAELQIQDNIARLNAQIEHIRVKTDIDVSKFGAVASEFDKVKVHVADLNRELDLQNQKLAELKRALSTSINTNGLNNVKTINLQTDIQKQIQAIDQLKAKINELNNIEPPKVNKLLSRYLNIKGNIAGELNNIASAFSNLRGATSSADNALTSVLNVVGAIPHPAARAVAAIAGLPVILRGLENSVVDLVKATAAAGDSTYVMSRGFQMSVADTGKFTAMCKTAGVEVNDLAMTVKRVQQSIIRGGDDAKAEQWLKRYGESAFDASGHLKNLNDMTLTMSRALKRAQAEGNGMAFVLGTMRSASADAITAIEDAEDVYKQAAGLVKSGLLDPKFAHEVQGNLNAMNLQTSYMKANFESALLPVANEIIPRLTDRMANLTQIIRDNKEMIRDFGRMGAEAFLKIETAAESVGGAIMSVGRAIYDFTKNPREVEIVTKYKNDFDFVNNDFTIKNVDDLIKREQPKAYDVIKANPNLYNQTKAIYTPIFVALHDVQEEIKRQNEAIAKELQSLQISGADASGIGQERRGIEQNPELLDNLRKARKYQEEADYLYAKPNLTNYERQIAELQKWRNDVLRETELSVAEREALERLYQAKLFNIEEEKKNHLAEMSEAVQSIYQTELEKRLAQIEKERQAWIDKCGDEVKATKLAEQQKADAQRNAAMQVIKQQAKEYEAYQKGGLAGLQAYKMADLTKSGVNLDYLNMTPQQLQQFQQANQLAEKGLMPQFMTDTDRAFYQQQMQQSYQRLKDEYDKDNYAIVNGQKMTMSEALGGVPIKIALDKDTQITLPPEAYAIIDGQKTTMNEALNKPTQAMMRDYETDNKGNLAAMSETQFAMPAAFDDAMKSFSEMPPVIQGTTESLSALPPTVQAAAEALNDLPIAVQGITENLAAVEFPHFTEIGQAAQEVVLKLDDFKTALSNFSFPQNDSAQRTPVNVNVTVQIQEAHAWDSEHIQELADKCADKMQPEIIRAIGGDSNSY